MKFPLESEIICGDSDLIFEELLDSGIKFDLILTDPPYNLHKDFGNTSDSLPIEEFVNTTNKRITKLASLLKPYGSLIWFGIHDYIGYSQIAMYNAGLYYRRMNIWHYENGFSRSKKEPATHYEPFLWFSKNSKKWTYNVDDVRVPYKSTDRLKNPVRYKGKNGEIKEWKPNPNGAMRGDVWDFPTLAGKRFEAEKTEHPSQKPESLIMELLKAYCPKDKNGRYTGYIFDPFFGSGTLGVCCERLNSEGHNIKWLGIELENKWCKVAKQRLDNLRKK